MALRQLLAACATGSQDAAGGLCGRLCDTVLHNNEGGNNEEDDNRSAHSAVWKDLTLSVLEPAIPKEIHVTMTPSSSGTQQDNSATAAEEGDSLLGLQLLDDQKDTTRKAPAPLWTAPTTTASVPVWHSYPTTTTDCSWTYSTASSHDNDLQEFLRFDDGSSYSSGLGGRPPRAPPVVKATTTTRRKQHRKTVSTDTTATVSTWSARSRSSAWGSF